MCAAYSAKTFGGGGGGGPLTMTQVVLGEPLVMTQEVLGDYLLQHKWSRGTTGPMGGGGGGGDH